MKKDKLTNISLKLMPSSFISTSVCDDFAVRSVSTEFIISFIDSCSDLSIATMKSFVMPFSFGSLVSIRFKRFITSVSLSPNSRIGSPFSLSLRITFKK